VPVFANANDVPLCEIKSKNQWGDIEQESARAGEADLVVENPALGLWRVSF
jgi:hypothetical protein